MTTHVELEHREVDKTGWKDGPWMVEGDKHNWITEAGLDGMIVRNRMGALCGYVAVAEGHPYFKVPYQRVADIEVHGGLTYSNECAGHICHVPEPGRPDDVWWLGFDCGHGSDYLPGMDAKLSRLPDMPHDLFSETPADKVAETDYWNRRTYKHLDYVKAEVEGLARQLVEGPHELHDSPYGMDDMSPAEAISKAVGMFEDVVEAALADAAQ